MERWCVWRSRRTVIEKKDKRESTEVDDWLLVAAVIEVAETELVPVAGDVNLTPDLEFNIFKKIIKHV